MIKPAPIQPILKSRQRISESVSNFNGSAITFRQWRHLSIPLIRFLYKTKARALRLIYGLSAPKGLEDSTQVSNRFQPRNHSEERRILVKTSPGDAKNTGWKSLCYATLISRTVERFVR